MHPSAHLRTRTTSTALPLLAAFTLVLASPALAQIPMPVQEPRPAPELEPELRAVLDNFNLAWAERSADAFVRDFADDGDFMQAFGRYRYTREAIHDFMTFFFSRQDEGFFSRETGVRVSYLTDDLVFLEQELEGEGVRNADGSAQPGRRGQMMLILRRTAEGWHILHYRYLDIHGGPIYRDPAGG